MMHSFNRLKPCSASSLRKDRNSCNERLNRVVSFAASHQSRLTALAYRYFTKLPLTKQTTIVACRFDALNPAAICLERLNTPMPHPLPYAEKGQVIGLFGGSFDPPHKGHVHVSKEALKRFALDRVWWLVSPGNPLKDRGPAPLERRITAAKSLLQHPRISVTDIEAHLGTRYTAQTLGKLISLYPGVQFVWLMGADNLAQFHRWQQWEQIMRTIPIGIMARPGQRISARTSVAAQKFRAAKLSADAATLLGRCKAPAWCFVNVPMQDDSSTEIRARGEWN